MRPARKSVVARQTGSIAQSEATQTHWLVHTNVLVGYRTAARESQGFAAYQATERKNTGVDSTRTVVGACAGQVDRRWVDDQGAVDIVESVVARTQATRGDRVAACIDGALRGAAVGQRTTQYRKRLAIDEAAVAYADSTTEGHTVIGLAGIVGCHKEVGGIDGVGLGCPRRQPRWG